MNVKKLTTLALLSAIALTIFMVEAQIPAPVPLPGVKLGLSNIITVFTVFAIGPLEAVAVLAVRIFMFLRHLSRFGNTTLFLLSRKPSLL